MASNNGHASSLSSSSSSTGKVSSKSRIQAFKKLHKLAATFRFITIIQDAFVNKRDSSAVVDHLLKHQIDIQLRRKTIMKMQQEDEDDDDDVEEPELILPSSTAFDSVFNFQKMRTKTLLKDLQHDNARNPETIYIAALAQFLFCFLQPQNEDDADDNDDDDDVEKPESSSCTVPNESSDLLEHDQKDIQVSRNEDPPQCVGNLAESSTVGDHDSTNNNDLQQVGVQDSQDHSENSVESSNLLEDAHQNDLQEARNDEDSTQAVVDMQQGGYQDQQPQADHNKELWPTLCDAEKKLKKEREMGIRNRNNKKKWNYRDG